MSLSARSSQLSLARGKRSLVSIAVLRKKEQGLVGDCSSRPDGLPLRVLEHVYVLGDSLDLEVVALHFVL